MMLVGLLESSRPELRTSYGQAQRLFRTRFARMMAGLAVLGVYSAVFVLGQRWLTIGLSLGVAVIGALGLQVLTGYAGQVSLGHATFLAIGYYTSVALSPGTYPAIDAALGSLPPPLSWIIGNAAGWPLFGGLFAAGAMAGFVGLLIGPTALRLKGLYLAIVTMALVFVGRHVFLNWESLTGGPQGRAYTAPSVGGFSFAEESVIGSFILSPLQKQFLLVVTAALLTLWLVANLRRSRAGRALQAIRDRDVAAEVIGVPVARYKMLTFAVSSAITGVAGALYGNAINYAVPESWSLALSIKYVAMIIIGGGGALGALLGAIFVELGPILIREWIGFDLSSITPFQFQELLYGGAIMLFLVAEPQGLAGIWHNARTYWRVWPFSY